VATFTVKIEYVVHDVVHAFVEVDAKSAEAARAAAQQRLDSGAYEGLYFEYARQAADPGPTTIVDVCESPIQRNTHHGAL
jgi:hypothetical protein